MNVEELESFRKLADAKYNNPTSAAFQRIALEIARIIGDLDNMQQQIAILNVRVLALEGRLKQNS